MIPPSPQLQRERDEVKAQNLANYHAVVTPNDSAVFEPSAIMVCGSAGHVVLKDISNNDVTYQDVPPYTIIPVRAIMVKATGTTATNIVRLY